MVAKKVLSQWDDFYIVSIKLLAYLLTPLFVLHSCVLPLCGSGSRMDPDYEHRLLRQINTENDIFVSRSLSFSSSS